VNIKFIGSGKNADISNVHTAGKDFCWFVYL